jgi:hypothetical protein
MPPDASKFHSVGGIACDVSFDLLFPKGASGFRYAEFRAMFMAVPEAPMDEDHGPVFRQDDVRPAGQRAVLGAVYCESVAKPVEHRSHRKFRLGVAAADARHHERALFWSENISHSWRGSGHFRFSQTDGRKQPNLSAFHALSDCPPTSFLRAFSEHGERKVIG